MCTHTRARARGGCKGGLRQGGPRFTTYSR